MTSEQEGGCCQALLVDWVQFHLVSFQDNMLLCTSVNLFPLNHCYNNRTSFVVKGNMLHPTNIVQQHAQQYSSNNNRKQLLKINFEQPERPMLVFAC